MKFIDSAKIFVRSGSGGHGCIAFRREKFVPKGGPSGGDGGHGGSIVLQADAQLSTLQDVSYRRHYVAKRGQHGQGSNKHGRNAQNMFIKVPVGTIVTDIDSEEILCDLLENEQSFTVAKGGNGGYGNARFKTQQQTAPRNANDGQEGQERNIQLELKVLADVGLVGFPNAGKSTFLSAVSAAKPKIADYPFTTLTPNLGIVKYGNFQSFVMADIPGLIEGASDGKGLGNRFLKHVERSRMLLYLVDGNSENIETEFQTLQMELQRHDSELAKRPSILLITKSDTWTSEDLAEKSLPDGISTLQISAVARRGLDAAIAKIARLLEELNAFSD